MGTIVEVPTGQLRRRLDPAKLAFETTAEVAPLTGTIGQPRARAVSTIDGTYPEGSVNRLVAERLQGFASRLRALGAPGNGAAAPDGRAAGIETTKSKEER